MYPKQPASLWRVPINRAFTTQAVSSKTIIAIEFGYGCDVSVTSSEFARQTYVSKMVNDYIVDKSDRDQYFVDKLGMPMYSLVTNIVDFIKKLQNKKKYTNKFNFQCKRYTSH